MLNYCRERQVWECPQDTYIALVTVLHPDHAMHSAFACLAFASALSAPGFLVIARCRLSNLPSDTVPPITSTIASKESLRKIEQRAVALLDLALQL